MFLVWSYLVTVTVWWQVHAVNYKELKACVHLVLPVQCETRGCDLNEESARVLLEATQNKVPLQELQLVFEDSGDLDQTALAIEHLRYSSSVKMCK